MEVKIAGYNLDHSQILKIKDQEAVTPETISAAYARISRSKKSVGALRREALSDVSKARSSNQSIVFEMGHASVAEHAVFNFDLTGVSRLIVEDIQRSRLASFTEKSQRYVTLKGDHLIPAEIKDSDLEDKFKEIIALQNELYHSLYEKGKSYLKDSGYRGSVRELQGKAKEDARYVLALATQTQLGMTINARSLERLLQRLDRSPLSEAAELKDKLLSAAQEIAPSLVRYTNCSEYEKEIEAYLPEITPKKNQKEISLVFNTPEPDNWILAALWFEYSGGDFYWLKQEAAKLSIEEKEKIISRLFDRMKCWDKPPRAFEIIDIHLNLLISSSCFGQLKRHRPATILRGRYHPENGFVIPPLLKEIKAEKQINAVMTKVEEFYYQLEGKKAGLGSYILSNAHRLSVLFKTNLRELYHFSRLRSDKHAQWEIREVSACIDKIIKERIPAAGAYLMGKDKFVQRG